MKLEIKVCGNIELNNLEKVCALQPDYIGFIFYKKSKRKVGKTKMVKKKAACRAKRVGVFVNATVEFMHQKIKEFELDIVQLHGNETPTICFQIGKKIPIFKAFQVNNKFNFSSIKSYKSACKKILFDTSSTSYGGSGNKFDWSLLKKYKLDIPFILSGGINEYDAEAIRKIDHPMFSGIDLNSGFEVSPGIKNIAKLTRFINQIRKRN